MSRYFFQIMYDGSQYSGWQRQENADSVQQTIETALSRLSGKETAIMGCGRTDAGVHASDYYFHSDFDEAIFVADELKYKLNKMLPPDIAITRIIKVADEAHARFDATSRSYIYDMHFEKDPFSKSFSFKYNQSIKPDFELMNKAARMLMEYKAFFPFCKTRTDVNNYNCQLDRSEWIKNEDNHWSYHVTANRFLRGMVRLMVGACIRVSTGKLPQPVLKEALDKQIRLEEAWSVPAHGLRLSKIQYPYI